MRHESGKVREGGWTKWENEITIQSFWFTCAGADYEAKHGIANNSQHKDEPIEKYWHRSERDSFTVNYNV